MMLHGADQDELVLGLWASEMRMDGLDADH